ncbi:MAG: nuclear transport factor 2 family protein [Erysipelotrichaceae bacterium]|nr:nuclear transport factor 2 family protein [Erysipelotrichaceae bacterium]
MELKELINRTEIRELVDTFAYLADIKDAKSQGDLFAEDGSLLSGDFNDCTLERTCRLK